MFYCLTMSNLIRLQVLLVLTCIISHIQFSECLLADRYIIEFGRPSKQPFSTVTQLCCNGIIYKKANPYVACCGNQTYNQQTHFCCSNTVSPKQENLKCCFNVVYNSQTHNCDYIVTRAHQDDDGLNSWTSDKKRYAVTPITNNNQFPCGEEIINLKTQICCKEKPIPITDPGARHCCGEFAYNPKTNFCCHNTKPATILPQVHNGEDACCQGKPYRFETETCIHSTGSLITKLNPLTEKLCDNTVINTKEKLCCTQKIKVLDEIQQYKEFIITKRKINHKDCCGNVSYSPSEEICVNHQLFPLKANLKNCYGSGLYDPSKDTCCRTFNFVSSEKKSKVYKNQLGSCCYLSLYDESKESCCGISVIPKPVTGLSGCCEFRMSGKEAEIDEFISVYKPPMHEIHGYGI